MNIIKNGDNQIFYFFITIAVMVVAGILGSYCRYFFDRKGTETGNNVDSKNQTVKAKRLRFVEIIVPGIVAAFIIPLFLSIGKSLLLTNVLNGVEFYENTLILFAFCLLAAVSAESFVNAVAQQALKTADEAKKEAVEAKDLSAEAIEGKLSVVEDGDRASFVIENTARVTSYDGTSEEKSVLSSLLNGDLSRRSITGIAKETGLPKAAVRSALQTLVQRGKVAEGPSNRTGVMLYQAILGPPDQNK